MEAKDLRIGNRLLRSNGSTAIVNWGVIKDIDDGDSSYKPITLTEEWLLKFGFWHSKLNGYWDYSLLYCFINKSDLTFRVGSYYDESSSVMADIKYVHQLQNLYFALTGEELEVKS